MEKKCDVKEFRKSIMKACKGYDWINWYGIIFLMNIKTKNITYTQIADDMEVTSGEHNGTQKRIYTIYNKKRINYLAEARKMYKDYCNIEDENI